MARGYSAAVAGHGAEVGHRLGPDRRRRRVLGEHLGQRSFGAVVACPEEVDVPHLGLDPGRGLAVTVGDRDALGLGQGRQTRLVEAAQGVDEGLREHQARLRSASLSAPLRSASRTAFSNDDDAGRQGARGHGRDTGLGHRLDRDRLGPALPAAVPPASRAGRERRAAAPSSRSATAAQASYWRWAASSSPARR